MSVTRHVTVRDAIVGTLVVVACLGSSAPVAAAQDPVTDVATSVVLDPTTFAPAVLFYLAAKYDWDTSQRLFALGYVEQNRRFTVSGRPNDLPVSYWEGLRRIRRMSLLQLRASAANNLAAEVLERTLATRYPAHRRWWTTLKWVEKVAFAALLASQTSMPHLRQGIRNKRTAG